MTDDPSRVVRALVREVIAEAEKPEVALMTEQVIARLSDGEKDAIDWLLSHAVHHIVREEMHFTRTPLAEARTEGSSRWQVCSRVRVDLLGIGVHVAGVWKWVEDLTATDLLAYAGEQWKRSQAIEQVALTAENLAAVLEAHEFTTVKEWDEAGRPGLPSDEERAA